MEWIPNDWQSIFMPEMPLFETFARAAILYFFILLVLRFLPRRTTGELGAMDLVFILLITESASHALGDFTTLGDGLVMLTVFILINYIVNQLTYRTVFFRKLFEQSPLPVVQNGKLLYRNMRKELLTKDELMAGLRENGIEDISQVKKAFVEGEGQLSFIKFSTQEDIHHKEKKPGK